MPPQEIILAHITVSWPMKQHFSWSQPNMERNSQEINEQYSHVFYPKRHVVNMAALNIFSICAMVINIQANIDAKANALPFLPEAQHFLKSITKIVPYPATITQTLQLQSKK